jgi:uncharacterized protein (DUF983 family)
MSPTPSAASFVRRALQIVGRAARRRCPNCGGAGIFATWLRMVKRCPRCGLTLEREQGYRVGAYMLNIVVAELVFVAILLGVLAVTWPEPPWRWLTYGSAAAMIALPIGFYPFAQTLFLGIDLLVHPPEDEDFRIVS